MQLTFGPFFTCFIITLFLAVYLYIITHHTSVFHKRTIQFSLIGILIILIRMSIPFNLSGSAKDGRIYDRKYC